MWSWLEWGLRIAQTVLWVCLVILGLFVIIPLAIVKSDFLGGCVLYSTAKWTVVSGKGSVSITPAGPGKCNFVLGAVGALCCVYGLVQGALAIFAICKDRHAQQMVYPNWCNFLLAAIHGCCTMVVMVAAILLSVGLKVFCDQLTHNLYPSCSTAQDSINWNTFDGSRFFSYTTFAANSAWACFLVMLLQTCGSIYLAMRKNYVQH